jgi:serine protease Do
MITVRNKRVSLYLSVVASVVAFVTGTAITILVESSSGSAHFAQADAAAYAASSAAAGQALPDFVSLAKKVGPSVVNVSTVQMRKTAEEMPGSEDDPFRQFWQRFFGGQMPRGPQRQSGLGSGFIIDRDGTIVTNYHVVDGADKITVTLSDGQSYTGKILGKDQKTDIAIVKIDARQDLPTVSLGDSDQLQVGEWVMAIGNPFGLDHTVTSGIVSAKGRRIGNGPYEDFIQTDASINPGNSGGPLVNMRGEVVGINSAIFSQSGGNIGIGFAIPTNLVKDLLPQLRAKGKIVRGFLGATIQKVTPEIAETMGLKQAQGALVADLTKDGPAARAGVKTGDVILALDGKEIRDSADLPLQVARLAPGKTVQAKVLRDGKELALPITVGEIKENEVVATGETGELGLAVQKLTPEIAKELGLERTEGVVITAVTPGSAADDAGLQRGDVIAEVNRHPVRTVADFKRETAETGKGRSVLFLVRRGQGSLFLALKP